MDNTSATTDPGTIPADTPVLPPPQKSGPFFERADWGSFGLTAFLIFVVYLYTLSPAIDLNWGGILGTAAVYGGVPHPPGFPLWTNYAHLFTVLVPFGNIGWRVSVSSAFASAIACGLIALLASRCGALIVANLRDFRRLDERSEKWLRVVSGGVAGTSFGLSGSVWSNSVVPDWWPLHFALFAAVLCLMVRWSYSPEKNRYLYPAILIYASTLMNDRTPSLFAAAPGLISFITIVCPALGRDLLAVMVGALLYILLTTRDSAARSLWCIFLILAIVATLASVAITFKTRRFFTKWNVVIGCVACVALGLALSFYSAISSMTNPPMNWGYPRMVEGFFHLLERGQYERLHPVDDWQRYWLQTQLYCKYVRHEYGWIYLLPAAIPFAALRRMNSSERRWMFGLLSFFLCMSFFLLAILNPGDDRASSDLHAEYFNLSYLSLAIWAGCGLTVLGTILARPKPELSACLSPGQNETWAKWRSLSRKL